jgi:hypothetical protein
MLKAETVEIKELRDEDKFELFKLFSQYYEQVSKDKFLYDLNNKDKIILLRCKSNKKIRGFSSLRILEFKQSGKVIIGIFSGDTIIDENFWGATALTFEFFKNVLKVKLKYPFNDVFWLLISKGFKTYLLLANNFQTYYPRFDKETPLKYQTFLNSAWTELYPEDYDKENGILRTAHKYDRLKSHIAKIGARELENPKISFFSQSNPRWAEGDELCCLGRIDMGLVIRYSLRTIYKLLKKRFLSKLRPRKSRI